MMRGASRKENGSSQVESWIGAGTIERTLWTPWGTSPHMETQQKTMRMHVTESPGSDVTLSSQYLLGS